MVELDAGYSTIFVIFVKDVTEDFLHGGRRLRMRVEGNPVWPPEAQRTHIIKPQDMVGMRVSVDHRIQPGDAFPDGLLSEIGRGIDEHAAVTILQHDGRPGTAVTRVSRGAHAAGAADGWHTHGCAAAQHCEHRFHFFNPAGPGPAPGGGPLAMALVISIQAMRNSKRTFWSSVCSRSVRLPLVLS